MKNLVIGLFVLGLTSLGFSQNKKGEIKEVKLNDVVITNVNFSYLEKVQDRTTADFVQVLETEASRYNVMESPKFDGRNEPFKIVFRGSKGHIIATYDNNGKILKTKEQYKDIKLPKHLMKSVLSQYPNSGLLKVVYTVNYNDQKEVEKTYEIQIMNNNIKKNLKISSGEKLNKAVTLNIDN
ncbi:hypothetical protein LX77_00200 [Gelidibacter algens]|uniref:Uncharacterized protein n=1 Tax=Gelidibacter algens TaxID=49280 RepID=A0A1A7QUE3_9FLAO|nr:hypothetical protein [Gelidibacter algens]OBX23141.1 hypothetical protein A9996_16160 [Gelidibacter algens]RAJ27627.1 hypothetical protein LX77_00200 [Gelidibacter algens]